MSEGPLINPDDYDPPAPSPKVENVPARATQRPRGDDPTRYPDGWHPNAAMEALAEEANALELTPAAQASKLLEEALPLAVAGVTYLSQFGETEKMRFDAQKYIIDRNLGTPTKEGDLMGKEDDPLDQLVGECVKYVEQEQEEGQRT